MKPRKMDIQRITLITPPPLNSLLYNDLKFEGVDSVTPPLNLLFLSAYIRQHGYVPAIVDGYANRYGIGELYEKVLETKPDIIGMTCTTPLFPGTVELARFLKTKFNLPIIVGGPHITATCEEALQYDCFDLAVIGEGEAGLLELLNALNNGGDLSKIDGILFKADGRIHRTAKRQPIPDLDVLPLPAWDLLPGLGAPYKASIVGTKKDKSTPIITSRGCPGRCIFCDTSTFGRNYRYFSAGYVLGMIKHLIGRYGINDFLIYDDTFCADKNRLKELCEGILSENLKISWQCCARIEHVDFELLKLMQKAGCWEIEYGIESGDKEILKLMRKGVNLEKAREVIRMTHELGIHARGNFIFGNIGETEESLQRTIRYILSTDLDYVQQSFLTPYPGSEVYRIAENYGEFDKDIRKMSNLTINFVPFGLTRELLKKYSRILFLKFYLRPRIIMQVLKSVRDLESLKRLAVSVRVYIKHVLDIRGARS